MQKSTALSAFRLLFAASTIIAIVVQFLDGHNYRTVHRFVNFFSFFTIQSNIIAVIVFIIAGISATNMGHISVWQSIRTAATMYMLTTGLVYAILLSGNEEALAMTKPWINLQLHVIMPLAVITDFLIDPPKRSFTIRDVLSWTIYPIVFLAWSLLRGPVAHWYPYPFLNPDEMGGYAGVAGMCLAIFACFVVLGLLIAKYTSRKLPTTS